MKGAREYAQLFKTGQYGKLFITSRSHARGKIFCIQILPDKVEAIPNHGNMCLNVDAVEVYGVIKGQPGWRQPGWTEEYGWLHKGKWQDDFEKLVVLKKSELLHEAEQFSRIETDEIKINMKKNLLEKY